MITEIGSKTDCCNPKEKPIGVNPYPHNHDERYYTKTEVDQKFRDLVEGGINQLLLGEGPPSAGIGKNGDMYIDFSHARRPIYEKRLTGWALVANLNPLDNEITDVTQQV